MKKTLLTLTLLLGFLSAHAAIYYVDDNNGIWTTFATYNSETDGTGSVPTSYGSNDFVMNGKSLTTANLGSTESTTLLAGSLTFNNPGERLQIYAVNATLKNTLNVSGGGDVLVNGGKTAVNFSIGTFNVNGGFFFRTNTSSRDQTLTISVGDMNGAGTLSFGDLDTSATDVGTISIGATNSTGFTGQFSPSNASGSPTLSLASNFSNATLAIDSGDLVQITHDIEIGGITGLFGSVIAGTYTAAELNAETSTTVFTGTNSITVVPEPSTYAALVGLFAMFYVIRKRRRQS